MKHKAISLLTTIGMMASFMTSTIVNAEPQSDTSSTIKIMSVGDSITDGYWEQGAYRKYMYNSLISNGITNIDMVGTKGGNEEYYSDGTVSFTYDGNYCGYSGYAIQNMTGTESRAGIYEVLTSTNIMETYDPDIVLLQIGTNDIISAYNDGIIDRLESLVDYMLTYMTEDDDTIFVTTIPNMDVSIIHSWFWTYGDEYYNVSVEDFTKTLQGYIDSYNSQIKSMVEQKQSEGCTHIQFADINSVVDYKTDLYDGVHPNEQGYEKMGEYWSKVLTSYLNGEYNPDVEVTTTEPTQPQVVLGDVNKDGKISYIDLVALKKHILEISTLEDDVLSIADINSDNTINILDVVALKNIILQA